MRLPGIRFVARCSTLVIACALALPAAAARHPSERYDRHKAGHPLRIVGYAGHAVGVILDTLIFQPAWYVGHYEPLYSLFGRYHNRVATQDSLDGVEAEEPMAPMEPAEPVEPQPN